MHVVGDVSVITWPAAHETEKQEQAMYTVGQCQGYSRDDVYSERGHMYIKLHELQFSIKIVTVSFFM